MLVLVMATYQKGRPSWSPCVGESPSGLMIDFLVSGTPTASPVACIGERVVRLSTLCSIDDMDDFLAIPKGIWRKINDFF